MSHNPLFPPTSGIEHLGLLTVGGGLLAAGGGLLAGRRRAAVKAG